MSRRADSSRWLAEQLQALGYQVSHATLNAHRERVEYDEDGNPIGYTAPETAPYPRAGRALGGYYGPYRRRVDDRE